MRNPITSRNAAFFAAGGFVAALFLGGAAHAITDTVFKYSTPKTGYYSLDPLSFAPHSNADAYAIIVSPNRMFGTSGGPCLMTGVNLPQGATMTALAVWYSSDTSSDVQVLLIKSKLADGTTSVAQLVSTDTSATRKVMTLATIPASVATVDNQRYSYSVRVCFADPGANVFYGGRITFTYTNAGD